MTVEKAKDSRGAAVPDLPGCTVVAETSEEVLQLVLEATELHIAGLREKGNPVPEPPTREYVQV